MPKISNSCKPEISGLYLHENFTEIFGLFSFEKTYLYCVNYKKNYPEMFKAKYD